MKRMIGVVSTIVVVVSLLQLFRVFTNPGVATTASNITFAALPLNTAREVTFAIDPTTFQQMTQREQLNQMRDWLLYSVASSTGMSADELSHSLFDLPPVRHTYLTGVANFDYSDIRSLALKDGSVIALVPAGSDAAVRHEHLAHIADAFRKDGGDKPAMLHIVEYTLDPEHGRGALTRRSDMPGTELFTPVAQYVEMPITSLTDLESFLKQADDVTFAKVENNHLILGGRKVTDHALRGITSEDIAAVWQSERKIKAAQDAFDVHIDEEQAAFNARWLPRLRAASELTRPELERQRDEELDALKAKIQEQQRNLKLVDGSGFSLDPAYDLPGLKAFLQKIRPDIAKIITSSTSAISLNDFDNVIAALGKRKSDPFIGLIEELRQSNSPDDENITAVLKIGRLVYQYQAARYDGDLQGTEAGMILFYTNLLAKLWALDYDGNAPDKDGTDKHVTDFLSIVHRRLPSMYLEAASQRSHTRLWFGPQHRGFQVAEAGQSLIFARTATRLYAASSNTLTPGEEAAANPETGAFLNWWDNHYEEVARYEPAYEQLNQIMKWSLLIGWVNEHSYTTDLAFLDQVSVRHNLWFPDWVQDHPQLRFQSWEKIHFHPRGYKGTTTEALPLLISDSYVSMGQERTLSGGVSLGSKQMFREIAPLADDIQLISRRSFLDYVNALPNKFKTIDNISYEIASTSTSRTSSVVAHAAEESRLTAQTIEVANKPVEQVIARDGLGVNVQTRIQDASVGELRVSPTTNGFAIGWAGRDIDLGYALGQNVLKAKNAEAVLRADPNVASFVKLNGDYNYLVKMRGSDQLLHMTPELAPSATVNEGFLTRVAAPDTSVPDLQMAWHDLSGTVDSMSLQGYLGLELEQRTGRFTLTGDIRGPPASGTVSTKLNINGQQIPTWLDQKTGQLYIDTAALNDVRIDTLVDLPTQLTPDDLTNIRKLASEGKAVEYTVPGGAGGGAGGGGGGRVGSIFGDENRPFRDIADDIANDPAVFAEHARKAYRSALDDVDVYLAADDYDKAYAVLDDLERQFGKLPDIKLRKGIAKILEGDVKTAVKELQNMAAEPFRNGESEIFFKEINARLAGNLSDLERTNMTRLAEYADWRNLRAQKGLSIDSVRISETNDALFLEFYVDELPKGTPVNPADIPDNAFIYVQDSPGLNNLDWHVGVHTAAQQAVTGDLGAAFSLPRGGLDGFNPTNVYVGTTVKLEARGAQTGLRGLNVYHPSNGDECSDNTPARQTDQCNQPTYVVYAKV